MIELVTTLNTDDIQTMAGLFLSDAAPALSSGESSSSNSLYSTNLCGWRKHFARNKRQYGSSTDGSNMTGRFWVSALCRQAAESLSPLPKQHVCLSFRRTKLAESEAISPSPRHLDCMTFTLCILHLFSMCHNFCSNAFEQCCFHRVKASSHSTQVWKKSWWHPSLEQNVCAWWGVVALPDKVEILQKEDLLANCHSLGSKSSCFGLSSCFFLVHPTSFLVHPMDRNGTLLHTEASIRELQEYKVEKRKVTLQLNQLYDILLYY